jgi:hypothetical protein
MKEFVKEATQMMDDDSFYDPFALKCDEHLADDDDVVIMSVKKPVVFVCERNA